MDGKTDVLLDTCVLINFAAIERIDLLATHPNYAFVITDHVRDEAKEHFTSQFDAVNAAVADATLREVPANRPEELADYAELLKHLGRGESSAIAVAKNRSMPLVIDDRQARNRAAAFHVDIELLTTADLVVTLIKERQLTVEEADREGCGTVALSGQGSCSGFAGYLLSVGFVETGGTKGQVVDRHLSDG